MSDFNTNKNSFLSSIQSFKSEVHSFQMLGIPKGTKNEKQQKKVMILNLASLIEEIDTDDFGIRIAIMRLNK